MPRADRTTSQDQPISLVSTDETPDLKPLFPLITLYIPNCPLDAESFETNESHIPVFMAYAGARDPICLDKSCKNEVISRKSLFLLFGEFRDPCATHAIVYVSAFFLAPPAEEPRGLAEEGRVGPTEVVGLCRTTAEGTVRIRSLPL